MRKLGLVIALLGASALAPALSHAQSPDAFAKALHIYGSYRVVPNITYLTANNWEAKLDVYQARDATTPIRRSSTSTAEDGSQEAKRRPR